MEERSQGCQTFISFLLTIGAEAQHGALKNTVLLLDEPETHLHPSGVRFMLEELKKAADAGNTVVFATHSVFMIDKQDYNRYVIVKKDKEHTTITPSKKDRIGYFMQEDVLFGALELNLGSEFVDRKLYNFVFEGDADAKLFSTLYSKFIKKPPFDVAKSSFYHGGKCSDIKKFFSQRPIQLGSTWIFVLDNDRPARELAEFLQGRYRDFLGKYIFVFHYAVADPKCDAELEDLLPRDLLEKALNETLECLGKPPRSLTFDGPIGCLLSKLSTELGDEEFKGTFKQILNQRVTESMEQIKRSKHFDETYSAYAAWAESVIESLSATEQR